MRKKIYSAKINDEIMYVKTYRKSNALRFFKKRDRSILREDVSIIDKVDSSIKVIDELYPEFIEKNVNSEEGKYYNMFK